MHRRPELGDLHLPRQPEHLPEAVPQAWTVAEGNPPAVEDAPGAEDEAESEEMEAGAPSATRPPTERSLSFLWDQEDFS